MSRSRAVVYFYLAWTAAWAAAAIFEWVTDEVGLGFACLIVWAAGTLVLGEVYRSLVSGVPTEER